MVRLNDSRRWRVWRDVESLFSREHNLLAIVAVGDQSHSVLRRWGIAAVARGGYHVSDERPKCCSDGQHHTVDLCGQLFWRMWREIA